jgi:hypothetical protein
MGCGSSSVCIGVGADPSLRADTVTDVSGLSTDRVFHDLSLKHALVPDFDCCQPDFAGYSNKFLLDFKDPIVALYGDVSPNESMHAKITTSLIKQYDLLPSHLSERVCSAVTDTIVFTDMAVSISSLTALATLPFSRVTVGAV